MKILKKTFLIITGFLMAGLLSSHVSIANTLKSGNFEIKDAWYTDALEATFEKESSQLLEIPAVIDDHCCKIYNSRNELVYMSKDKTDQRLKQLKKRCDLIMKTDSSSYYLLGD